MKLFSLLKGLLCAAGLSLMMAGATYAADKGTAAEAEAIMSPRRTDYGAATGRVSHGICPFNTTDTMAYCVQLA